MALLLRSTEIKPVFSRFVVEKNWKKDFSFFLFFSIAVPLKLYYYILYIIFCTQFNKTIIYIYIYIHHSKKKLLEKILYGGYKFNIGKTLPFFSLSFSPLSVIQYKKVLFIHPPLNNLCSPDSFFTFLYSFCERKSCQCMHKTCFHNFWRKATLALFFTFIYPFVALPHYLFLISIYNFVSLLSFLCDEIYFVWKKKTIWGVQNSTSLFFLFPSSSP